MAAHPLDPLYNRLRAWRGVRFARRVAAAGSVWLAAALWSTAGLIGLDTWLHLSRAARLVAGVLLLAVLLGLAAAWIVTAVRSRESLISLALQWEASLRSDGDLVAALQFAERMIEGTALPLERAVVEYVGACAPHLPAPPRAGGLPRSTIGLAGSLILAVAWYAVDPAAADRLKRLALIDGQPAAGVQIMSLSVLPSRGAHDSETRASKLRQTLFVPASRPLSLRVAVVGTPPKRAEVRLLPADHIGATTLALIPVRPADGVNTWYQARLPPLGQPATCEVRVGDTPAHSVRLIPVSSPAVSLVWQVAPAQGSRRWETPGGSLEISAPPHARLWLTVQSPQRLTAVELVVGTASYRLMRVGKDSWVLRKPVTLPPTAGRRAYSLRVRDAYGFTWQRLVQGGLRVQAPAALAVSLVSPAANVLSQSAAEIRYLARGGAGVTRLALQVRLWREDSLAGHQQRTLGVGPGNPTLVAGTLWLDLAELHAMPGDELEVLLEAAAADEGSIFSEPLRLSVVDALALVEQLRKPEAWLEGDGGDSTGNQQHFDGGELP